MDKNRQQESLKIKGKTKSKAQKHDTESNSLDGETEEAQQVTVDELEIFPAAHKKEKRRKREKGKLDTSSEVVVNKALNRKNAESGEVVDGSESAVSNKAKKKRKRDVKTEEGNSSAEVREEEEDVVSEPKKKKSKNTTGLQDPSEDPSLTDQARKALEYAFTQFRRPKKWKFHKARQNWIIRNVWSSENIPDSQMPLVLRYLSNVQGGVRENLVKTCRKMLETSTDVSPTDTAPPDPASSSGTQSQGEGQSVESKPDPIKVQRATALLEVLMIAKESPE